MQVRSTARLGLTFVATAAGLLLAVVGGVGPAAVLVAPWFLVLVAGMAHRFDPLPRVSVTVGQERLVVGDELELLVRVDVDDACFVRVTPAPFQQHRSNQLPPPDMARLVAFGRPAEPARLEFVPVLGEWGVWDMGRASVHVESPLGLFEASGRIQAEQFVRVHPTTEQLRAVVRPFDVRTTAGLHPSRASARGVEFADLRPHGIGDSMRDINWRASARAGELIVSQRHPDRATNVVLLVDSFIESNHDARDVLTMVVQAATALARGHLGATDRVGLVEFGGLVRWVTPGVGDLQLHRLVEALLESSLYANAADKELPRLSPRVLPTGCMILALSPLLDERFIAGLHEARARGHDVAVLECVAFDDRADAPSSDEPRLATAERLRALQRSMMRDELLADQIVVRPWWPGESLPVALDSLDSTRRRMAARR